MDKVKHFYDLIVYQKAELLFDMVCEDVKNFPNESAAFIIKNQWLDSSSSVSANIAQGHGCGYSNEYVYSLKVARKENSESLSWAFKSFRRNYINKDRLNEYENLCEEIRLMLNSIMAKIKKTDH